MYIIAKVVDGKIVDVYKKQVYKTKKHPLEQLEMYQDVGILPEYKVWAINGLEEVVQ